MAGWAAFATATPDLAAAGRGRLEATELVLVGTIKADGSPRTVSSPGIGTETASTPSASTEHQTGPSTGATPTPQPDAISKRFKKLVASSGVPPFSLHEVRHTYATLALHAGVHVKIVSERLGHSSVLVTLDTYSHAIPSMQAAVEQVADLEFNE